MQEKSFGLGSLIPDFEVSLYVSFVVSRLMRLTSCRPRFAAPPRNDPTLSGQTHFTNTFI
jgi:hypothetical protein